MSLYQELKRRNVFRVSVAYIAISWVILQAVDVVLNNIDAPVWIFQTILLLMVVGFIPVVVFAWAFEMTPEGIKRESEVDRSQSITHETGRKLTRVVVIFVVLGVAYFLFNRFLYSPEEPPAQQSATEVAQTSSQEAEPVTAQGSPNSVAVLPFTNMSGDPATEPFALGIHDDLLTHLSRIKALKTTSRTSVLQYKDTTKTIPQIAGELNVANILEGGIQRSGNRVRINLQLIDAASDAHLWAEIYDRELTAENLFDVQADVATHVANALQATLLPEEESALAQAPTKSMAAYDLYLLGRYHWHLATAESAEQARQYFAQAIEEDPGYVPALAGLADAYVALEDYGNLTGDEAFPRAQELLDQAMLQDDEVSEVWASLGQLRLRMDDQPGALEALGRAIELDAQNFWAWYRYGQTLRVLRRFDESLAAFETAYSIEPMSRPINETLGVAYERRGQFARSRRHFERVDQLQDKDPTQWKERIARTYLQSGELARAVIQARDVLALDPSNTDAMGILVRAYARLDDLAEAGLWAGRAEQQDALTLEPIWAYEARGDHEGAITFLEDWMMRIGTRPPGPVYLAFYYAHLGQMRESAANYAQEFLKIYGERPPINPYDFRPRYYLFAIEYMMNRGADDLNWGAEQQAANLRNLEEVAAGTERLHAQGYEHPETYYALAMARSLQGKRESAIQALDEAVSRGYVQLQQFKTDFALDPLRDDPRLADMELRMTQRIEQERSRLAEANLAEYRPAGKRPVVALPRETLENYAGHYTDGNVVLHFYFDARERFTFNLGQHRAPQTLVASADGEFYNPDIPADTFRFARNESGSVSHVFWEYGGSSRRFKAIPPPPAIVELDRATLESFVGTYEGERISNAADGTSDLDVWVIRVFLDEEGVLWSDFDNQPDLVIKPISATEFISPGFVSVWEFFIDPGAERAHRFIWHTGGRTEGKEWVFERQE